MWGCPFQKGIMKISFGVMVNDIQRLDMVFCKSEIGNDVPAYFVKEPESATKGLNILLDIIEKDRSDIAVLCHADMYFRAQWIEQVKDQTSKLPESWVIAGVIGKDLLGRISGRMHDMRIPQHFDTSDIHDFPQQACCFDECVLIINMKKKFRFLEQMEGFDLYGTLCVLQALEQGGTSWVIDAFCEHYCMRPFSWLPDETFKSNFKWIWDKYSEFGRIDSTAIGVPEDSSEQIIDLISI